MNLTGFKNFIENSQKIDGFEFFFKKDNEIFGGTDDDRLVFAKLKIPDEDATPEWIKDADFSGINLKKLLNKERSERLFTQKDVKNIKVISKEDVKKELEKNYE